MVTKRKFLFLFSFFFLISRSPLFAKSERIILSADRIEWLEKEVIKAEGNVTLSYKQIKVKADLLRYDLKRKLFQAEGKVSLKDKEGSFWGEYLDYTVGEKLGFCSPARVKTKIIHCRGQEIERLSHNRILVRDGFFTTCELDQPHYRFQADKILVFPHQRILAKGVKVYLWNIPVIPYIPYLVKSLEKKPTGIKFEWGHSSRKGFFFQTKYLHKWKKYLYGAIWLDFTSRLGICRGIKEDLNYRLGSGSGNFSGFYSQEGSREGRKKIPVWQIGYSHSQRLPTKIKYLPGKLSYIFGGTTCRTKVDLANADYYTFYGTPYDQMVKMRNLESEVSFSKNFKGGHYWGLRFYEQTDLVSGRKSGEWPSLTYSKYAQEIGNTGIFFNFRTNHLHSFRRYPPPQPGESPRKDEQTISASSKLGFSYSRRFFFLDWSPRWEVQREDEEIDRAQRKKKGKISSSFHLKTTIFRIFPWRFFNLYHGMRHLIEPSLSYSYTLSERQAYKLEDLSLEEDADQLTEKLSFSLFTAWQVKKVEKEYKRKLDLFSLRAECDFVLLSDEFDYLTMERQIIEINQLSPLFLKFSFQPVSNFDLNFRTYYDWEKQVWERQVLEGSWRYQKTLYRGEGEKKEKMLTLLLGCRYSHSSEAETEPTTFSLNPFQLKLYLPELTLQYRTSFNLMEMEWSKMCPYHSFSLVKGLHCWELEFQISDGPFVTPYTFTLRIKKIPEIAIRISEKIEKKEPSFQ